MSKVSNALNMYFLILSRGKMSISEIAKELEVSPRIIKTYKEDLEKAGLYIASDRGRHGGYYIDSQCYINLFSLSDEEMMALKMTAETIRNGQYHYAVPFERLAGKIMAAQEDCQISHYHNKSSVRTPEVIKGEKQLWHTLNLAIIHKNKVQITYKSLKPKKPEIKERMVDPYGLFDYKGASYFYGYCFLAAGIRFFKLSRILSLEKKPEKFSFVRPFNFKEVLERSLGIFNDEPIFVKLHVHYPFSEIVKEMKISPDQLITEIDDQTIFFEATMKGYTEIKSWVLSMGRCVTVMRPAKLARNIEKEAQAMMALYEKKKNR